MSLVNAALLAAAASWADDIRPVQVQLREHEPGVFLVQWQVPKVIPVQATPTPRLPDGCEPEGEHLARDQETAWIHRQVFRCSNPLAGRTLGIHYPFFNASLSTVLRVSLLSGEQHARILAPGEDAWELPAGVPDVLRVAQQGLLFGIDHFFEEGVHVVLIAVFSLLGSTALVARFAIGQLVAIPLVWLGVQLAPGLGELGVATGVALLAREALRAPENREQVTGLAVASGLVHGLGLPSVVSGTGSLVLAMLGMDVVLVFLGAVFSLVLSQLAHPTLRAATYALGSLAAALGLALFFAEPPETAEATAAGRLPGLSGVAGGGPGSRRIAPQIPDASIQSFVAIEAFETRHEVLVRLKAIAPSGAAFVEIDDQPELKKWIADMIQAAVRIQINGEERVSVLDRVDFVTVDAQGVLPRPSPVRESVDDASIGVTIAYLTSETPREVEMEWRTFPGASASILTTIIDPESTRVAELTPERSTVVWVNALAEEPIPTVSAVAVEPARVPLPLLSIPFLVAAFVLAWKRRAFALARISLAFAVLVGPIGDVAVAIPSSSAPPAGEARRILASILPNLYRAFEFREESAAYDRLAVSVTGETLTDVYLEHRRALEMEERGGARARVEAVEVQNVETVTPGEAGGFEAVAAWTVGGTVTHFGHRHFRENRYQATVNVVPVDDVWKVRSIEVLDEKRVR